LWLLVTINRGDQAHQPDAAGPCNHRLTCAGDLRRPCCQSLGAMGRRFESCRRRHCRGQTLPAAPLSSRPARSPLTPAENPTSASFLHVCSRSWWAALRSRDLLNPWPRAPLPLHDQRAAPSLERECSRPDHHECHHMISINRQDQAGTSGAQTAQRSPMGATSIILF
jgi:hypothetical protein